MRLLLLRLPLRTGHYLKANLAVDLRINQSGLHDDVAAVSAGAVSQNGDMAVTRSLCMVVEMVWTWWGSKRPLIREKQGGCKGKYGMDKSGTSLSLCSNKDGNKTI